MKEVTMIEFEVVPNLYSPMLSRHSTPDMQQFVRQFGSFGHMLNASKRNEG
jgi:hypothetical protein